MRFCFIFFKCYVLMNFIAKNIHQTLFDVFPPIGNITPFEAHIVHS